MAAYQSQGQSNQLVSFSEIEAGEGGGVTSLLIGVVADNITLDGWIIIGILFLLGAWCGVLFVNKTYTYRLMIRENHHFLRRFKGAKDFAAIEQHREDFSNSPLYKIFEAGMHDLRAWQERHSGQTNARLSQKAFNIFRSVLENGYMEQNRRINAGLIVLTMAISGAPFLGLLGTVWGVMSTFAAMAAAGEANIAAIAPGVASALATTVFGLIVAIPALFGYNFLAGRVKIIGADLVMFVDRFANLVDHEYCE
jgi:biopolymer transport protein ExbB